ncbi:pitrilysin family protein [Ferrovibrio sp.]|uniref:M16 family metallopeptidase n=1 Tax=Ferrovibrio sp. TaxID=1917215 RepID=UPI000CC5CD3E|nr:pitrilysin family protein [Ferrovibrio sp.]PJI42454.1 MAG: peptidase M16 [Ferrovibrio sp.]
MPMRKFVIAVLLLVCAALPAVAGPKIERIKTPLGIEVWFVREPSIPIVSLQATWRGGSSSDPAGQEGLAQLVTGLLNEGAGDLSADDFQIALQDGAIDMGFGADRDYTTATLRTLTRNRARAFELLKLALTAPRFDDEPVQRVKAQARVAYERSRASPNALVGERFAQLAYGDHPYGRRSSASTESLERIDRAALAGFTRSLFARSNLVIGAVGDVAPDDLARLVDTSFGALPAQATVALPAQVTPKTAAQPVVIPFPNPQSIVLFGAPGIAREDPDWYAATVLNQVLGGGGMTSRLFEEVREKRGLVYSVGTQLTPYKAAALVSGSLATANAQVGDALKLVRAELARVAKEGVTDGEMASAKSYMTGSFPLRLTSNAAIAGMLVAIQNTGLPPDYIDAYPGLINAVTQDDILRVAQRLFARDDYLVVVVGQPAGLETPGGKQGG